jgi:hypothetical protein
VEQDVHRLLSAKQQQQCVGTADGGLTQKLCLLFAIEFLFIHSYQPRCYSQQTHADRALAMHCPRHQIELEHRLLRKSLQNATMDGEITFVSTNRQGQTRAL